MRYKKLVPKEDGYLLLESLLTIIILMAVITILSPLTVNWLSKHREVKGLAEESRQLYEASIILNNHPPKQLEGEDYAIQIDKHCIHINETGTEVIIYESVFKR